MKDKKEEVTFEEVYLKYNDAIFRYCYHKLNLDRHAAEDIASDVFTALLLKWDNLETHTKPGIIKWLYSTAKNMLMKYYRDMKTALVIVSFNDCIKSDEETKESEYMASDDNIVSEVAKYIEYINEIRDRLDKSDWIIFESIVVYKRSIAMTANMLSLKENTVKVSWYRLKNKLKTLLSDILNV